MIDTDRSVISIVSEVTYPCALRFRQVMERVTESGETSDECQVTGQVTLRWTESIVGVDCRSLYDDEPIVGFNGKGYGNV